MPLRPIQEARCTSSRADSISVATSARTCWTCWRSSGGRPGGRALVEHLLHGVEEDAVAEQVLERPLVRGLCDPERRGAHHRPGQLEGRQRVGGAAAGLARACPRQLRVELVDPAEQVVERDPAVLEDQLGGLGGADSDLRLLLAHPQARRVLGDDEGGLTAMAEVGVDGGDDHVDVGDPAVGDEDLGPVQDPFVAVSPGGGPQALHVGSGLRLGDRVGAELELVADAEALGDPAADLLRCAGRGEAGGGQGRARDRQRDAGAAPVHLLRVDRAHLPVGVRAGALDRLQPAEALTARLAHDLPRHALVRVVDRRRRPDHVAGELAAAPLPFELLVVEREVHLACLRRARRRGESLAAAVD